MAKFRGLLYVKHGRLGSRSEGPDYYLQTWRGEYLVRDSERLLWQPDYRLEFFTRRIVEIDGSLVDPATIRVAQIHELPATTVPRPEEGEAGLGVPLMVRAGQRLQIRDEPVAVQFAAVVAESRRVGPHGELAGRCTVHLQLVPEVGEAATFDLIVDADAPELAATKVLGYHVTLHDVVPHPSRDEPQPHASRYVATIMIDRLE